MDTENTRPEWLQYLMETTLLGWPLRAAISCPVTKFHILQLRSVRDGWERATGRGQALAPRQLTQGGGAGLGPRELQEVAPGPRGEKAVLRG